jgi:23S rRNA (adenine2503-C2)-methyltransferase
VTSVYDLTLEQLTERLAQWGEPAFRARQVHRQHRERAAPYDRMPDVPKALRERLATKLPLEVEVLQEREADRGATRKALLRLGGRHAIETGLRGSRDRVPVGVSTQAGCAMGCVFCATGQMGLRNNLTAGEIAAQVVWGRREAANLPDSTPRRLTNVVFMGMGEPLSNERHTFGALEKITGAMGLGDRHVTVSTVGVAPAIRGWPRRSRRWGSRSACTPPTTGCGTSSCPSTGSGRSPS